MFKENTSETVTLLLTIPEVSQGIVYRESIDGFEYLQNSFGQNGEDIVLNRFLIGHKKGKYLDIGAYHPFKFSNTALLYKSGWTGVNIDASGVHFAEFSKYRPLDLNVSEAVTKDGGEHIFYEYEEGAFNTFSESTVAELHTLGVSPVLSYNILSVPFEKIVEEYVSPDTYVVNIDIEGLDYDLLESPIFAKFQPCFLIFESANSICFESFRLSQNPFFSDYDLVSVLFNSFILRSKNCALLHVNLSANLESN